MTGISKRSWFFRDLLQAVWYDQSSIFLILHLQCGWYWGPLGWEDAEEKLDGKPDGSFLVRDSSDDRYILSLSFRSQNATHHTRIEHYKGNVSQRVGRTWYHDYWYWGNMAGTHDICIVGLDTLRLQTCLRVVIVHSFMYSLSGIEDGMRRVRNESIHFYGPAKLPCPGATHIVNSFCSFHLHPILWKTWN